MDEGLSHRFDVPALNGIRVAEIILAANTAHTVTLVANAALTSRYAEAIDPLESQERLEDGLELGHLFLAVEFHELP